jgi:hypothetical protein
LGHVTAAVTANENVLLFGGWSLSNDSYVDSNEVHVMPLRTAVWGKVATTGARKRALSLTYPM